MSFRKLNIDMTLRRKEFVDEMYKRITLKAYPEYSHPTAFVCETELEQLWSEEDIKRALGYSFDEDLRSIKGNLLKTLSTLILIDIPNFEQAFDLLCPLASRQRRSCNFPFSKTTLDCLEIQHRDRFFEKQYLFCPIVIENRPEAGIISKDSMHRFPFMDAESTSVGLGGYGDVRINRIAPQYYRDTSSAGLRTGNSEVLRTFASVFR